MPFAFAFDGAGRLIVTEAGTSSVTSYNINSDGSLAVVDASVANHQAATCRVTAARGYFFVADAGSADLSGYAITSAGTLVAISVVAAAHGLEGIVAI